MSKAKIKIWLRGRGGRSVPVAYHVGYHPYRTASWDLLGTLTDSCGVAGSWSWIPLHWNGPDLTQRAALYVHYIFIRHCATSRKVPGSIPGVEGFFSVASDSFMWPGVDSASKNEYQVNPGGKGGRWVRLTTYHPHVKKSGGLNLLEPCGPVQACNGTALPLPFAYSLGVCGFFTVHCNIVTQFEPTKCTFSKLIFQLFYVFYTFLSRRFIFR
jgi:hypothetical protein